MTNRISFIHLFNKYLMCFFFLPGTVQGAEHPMETKHNPSPGSWSLQWRGETNNKQLNKYMVPNCGKSHEEYNRVL
jgi:hypothetical protein